MHRKKVLNLIITASMFFSGKLFAETQWQYLSDSSTEIPQSICQALQTDSSVMLVEGVDGCQETMPYAGFLNINGISLYHSTAGVSQSKIKDIVNQAPQLSPGTGDAWNSAWTQLGYASSIKKVYFYLSSDNYIHSVCGIALAPGQYNWPILFRNNTASEAPSFPWSSQMKKILIQNGKACRAKGLAQNNKRI